MHPRIAVIKGDGIGIDVTDAALFLMECALRKAGALSPKLHMIAAGAGHFLETGSDIMAGGEAAAGDGDAIFLGAIGLPAIRHDDGTEISPHLRLRDRYQLYAGVRPVKAFPNIPNPLSDPRASAIDMVIIRESTEGLFYTAAVHGRSHITNDAVCETMRISRPISEKLHNFAFRLAQRRKDKGGVGKVTCVDKANVFTAMAFFREIFDQAASTYPTITADHCYVDAMALNMVRHPWELDVLVTENMFGDILSDLAGGLVGGMGMAACGEIGDEIGLFQPAHGSAPDIMGQDKANPLAAIMSASMMLDYIHQTTGAGGYDVAAEQIDHAIATGFNANLLRPMEFGGDMGTKAITQQIAALINS